MSMFAIDRPTPAPPYQPESTANANWLVITAHPARHAVPKALANFMFFSKIIFFACTSYVALYGAGTFMTVFVMVTAAVRAIALPFTVVITAVGGLPPVVDIVIEASDNMVPVIVEPVPMLAPAGTYQKTFLDCAPLMSRT